ncbi:hypothetical protein BWGOE4_55360 [Bacillus mycoides]|nr:hypothetical protein BWGOE3_57420 [Bacillus mycoides]OFD36192.1 hypothetical protein BWGOE2_55300 [Bacillus mycoides]OFD52979.1 hypothetical protein BWGOE4_55360 [Bacillus mycoides]OFD53183.1 hypothetical protein BWGOE6_56390 [Bacillus mycoides]OFD53697.1 hypothetical protein BWGOE7_57290 [Bacillus mycoides]
MAKFKLLLYLFMIVCFGIELHRELSINNNFLWINFVCIIAFIIIFIGDLYIIMKKKSK